MQPNTTNYVTVQSETMDLEDENRFEITATHLSHLNQCSVQLYLHFTVETLGVDFNLNYVVIWTH